MKWYRLLLLLVVPALTAGTASAGLFFKKHPKPDPAIQAPASKVPALIGTLRTDPDEKKREMAAEELRHYDANAYPEIIAVLIAAVEHDPTVNVRLEAIQSLAKLRPVSQQVGAVLEQAMEHDQSLHVRLQGRTSLMQYRLAGYHAHKTQEPKLDGVKTEEPPLAGAPPSVGVTTVDALPQPSQPIQTPGGARVDRLVPKPQGSTPAQKNSGARPLPRGPVRPAQEPPPPVTKNEGPELSPPE